jgi:hypothetical protein
MPTGFKPPKLPAGWEYIDSTNPDPAPPPAEAASTLQSGVGSVLREIAGPRQPPDNPPTFLSGFLEPTAREVARTVIPQTLADVGIFAASLLLGGPVGPAARLASRVSPELAGVVGGLGRTGVRRVLGTGLGGALGAAASGGDPTSAAVQGIATQLGGESISKLTQWARSNAQVMQLARTDPERLGQLLQPILPRLGAMRSPRDFHAAFKRGAAQSAISEAYRTGLSDISTQLGNQPITSGVMTQIRSARPTPGQNPMLSGWAAPGRYSFDDIAETIRRLRSSGWNGDEAARGLGARDARQAADSLEADLLSGLPPPLADAYTTVNGAYARGARVISFMDDPKLFTPSGDLNIPRLQQKFKSEGYSTGDSYQLAADAVALEQSLFRGAPGLIEDVAGTPGRLLPHVYTGGASLFPKLPSLPTFAGTAPPGTGPTGGSLIAQMLGRGVGGGQPNSLRAPDQQKP